MVAIKRSLDGKSAMSASDTVLPYRRKWSPLMDAAHANGLRLASNQPFFFYEEPLHLFLHASCMVLARPGRTWSVCRHPKPEVAVH
jgi:hypothetical protein